MTLRRLHRLLATALGLFLVAHIANHVAIFWGAEAHLTLQSALRHVYRLPGLEHLLIIAIFIQLWLGYTLMQRAKRPGPWGRAQRISGTLFAGFVLIHVSAVVMTRMVYTDIDTNTYWAASVVSRAPFIWFFFPYYTIGLAALLVHIAAALRFRGQKTFAKVIAVVSVPFAILIVAGFAGVFHPIDLPPAYDAYLSDYWF